jgi:hypothetical protein
MEYLFSKCTFNDDGTATIPSWAVDRWLRQMNTPYAELPEDEKDSDRKEADKFLALLPVASKLHKGARDALSLRRKLVRMAYKHEGLRPHLLRALLRGAHK